MQLLQCRGLFMQSLLSAAVWLMEETMQECVMVLLSAWQNKAYKSISKILHASKHILCSGG